jgi:TM2 domain-containing membrane protein YozV
VVQIENKKLTLADSLHRDDIGEGRMTEDEPARSLGVDEVPELPPHPMDMQWRMSVGGKTYGPYSGRQMSDFVKEGRVEPSTLIARKGAADWSEAKDDTTLASYFDPNVGDESAKSRPTNQTTIQIGEATFNYGGAVGERAGSKSPGMALLLALLFPGTGHFYTDRLGKGLVILGAVVLTWFLYIGWAIWIWSMIDAYNEANEVNSRLSAKRGQRENQPRQYWRDRPKPRRPAGVVDGTPRLPQIRVLPRKSHD